MLSSLMDLLILSLAVCQVLETWRYGSIFAPARAYIETREGFFAELLQCNFCLSHWVAGFFVLLYLASWWCPPLFLFAVWFAVIKVVNWLWLHTGLHDDESS